MNKSLWLSNAATAIMASCAIGMTVVVVKRELAGGGTISDPSSVKLSAADWKLASGAGTRIGAANPRVTIVDFSDFQCPYCAKANVVLDSLLSVHGDRIAIVYRHFPIAGLHPHARKAALASECAGARGRFAEYSRALFASRDSIGVTPWTVFAHRVGITDTAAFGQCVQSEKYAHRLAEDSSAGRKLRINGTPTIFIDGVKHGSGWPGSAVIDERLKQVAK